MAGLALPEIFRFLFGEGVNGLGEQVSTLQAPFFPYPFLLPFRQFVSRLFHCGIGAH